MACDVKPRESFQRGSQNPKGGLTPQQRLTKLIKTAITRIEGGLASSDDSSHAYFHASAVLKELRNRLQHTAGKNGYSVFKQLILNEISEIDDCLDSGCVGGSDSRAGKLYATLKSSGTVFVASTPRSQLTYQVA